MHTDETKNQFIELRAQGWSLPRISEHLAIPVTTLGTWNTQHRVRIHQLRRAALEEAEERILGSCTEQAEFLAQSIKAVDQQLQHKIQRGDLRGYNLQKLVMIASRLRTQLARIHPRSPREESALTAAPSTQNASNSEHAIS